MFCPLDPCCCCCCCDEKKGVISSRHYPRLHTTSVGDATQSSATQGVQQRVFACFGTGTFDKGTINCMLILHMRQALHTWFGFARGMHLFVPELDVASSWIKESISPSFPFIAYNWDQPHNSLTQAHAQCVAWFEVQGGPALLPAPSVSSKRGTSQTPP